MTSGACGTILLHNSFANGLLTLVREEVGRPHIKNGDVLMCRGRSLESRIVRWVTRSEYSHAGLAVWWNGRLMVMEAVGRGVIVTPRSKNFLSYPGYVEWFTSVEEIHWRCCLVSDPQEDEGVAEQGQPIKRGSHGVDPVPRLPQPRVSLICIHFDLSSSEPLTIVPGLPTELPPVQAGRAAMYIELDGKK